MISDSDSRGATIQGLKTHGSAVLRVASNGQLITGIVFEPMDRQQSMQLGLTTRHNTLWGHKVLAST